MHSPSKVALICVHDESAASGTSFGLKPAGSDHYMPDVRSAKDNVAGGWSLADQLSDALSMCRLAIVLAPVHATF